MLRWVLAGLVAAAVLGGLAALLLVRTKGQADLRRAVAYQVARGVPS